MKATCKAGELKKVLRVVQKMLPRSTTIPSLEGVLVEARDGEIRVTAHDLDTGGTLKLEAVVESAGKVLMPGKRFCDIVDTFRDGDTVIEAGWNTITLKHGNSRAELVLLNADDYPPFPVAGEYTEVAAPAGELKSALRDVVGIPDGKGGYFYTRGVLFEVSGNGLNLVATDTHRLVVRKVPGAQAGAGGFKWLVPVAGLANLAGVLEGEGQVAVRFSDRFVHFIVPGGIYYARLLNGQYPVYRMVFPTEEPAATVKVDTVELIQALQRVKLMEDEIKRISIMSLTPYAGAVMIKSVNCTAGTVQEILPAEVQGEKFTTVHLDAKYLLSIIPAAGEKTVLNIYDRRKPVMVRPAGDDRYEYEALLLPIVIDGAAEDAPQSEEDTRCA